MRVSTVMLATAVVVAACLMSTEAFVTSGISSAGVSRSAAAGICSNLPLKVCVPVGR